MTARKLPFIINFVFSRPRFVQFLIQLRFAGREEICKPVGVLLLEKAAAFWAWNNWSIHVSNNEPSILYEPRGRGKENPTLRTTWFVDGPLTFLNLSSGLHWQKIRRRTFQRVKNRRGLRARFNIVDIHWEKTSLIFKQIKKAISDFDRKLQILISYSRFTCNIHRKVKWIWI